MALHQHSVAQNFHGSAGHATRAGLTEKQPEGFKYSFPKSPQCTDKQEERDYLKGRLAAAFRIFGDRGFDEGVAGHITVRDPVDSQTLWVK